MDHSRVAESQGVVAQVCAGHGVNLLRQQMQVHRALDRVVVPTVDEDGRDRLTGPKRFVLRTHELDQVAPCRRVLEDRLDATRQALKPPDDDRAALAAERHGVYKPSLSTWCVDRSLEDRRAVMVGANRGATTLRPKLEVAAIRRVEETPEERISVVARSGSRTGSRLGGGEKFEERPLRGAKFVVEIPPYALLSGPYIFLVDAVTWLVLHRLAIRSYRTRWRASPAYGPMMRIALVKS